jgi:hypothetical protein
MMVTTSRIPIPEPIAPMKSARTVKASMHTPQNAAAVGMYLFSNKKSRNEHRKKYQSLPCGATTFAPPCSGGSKPPKGASGKGAHGRGGGRQPYIAAGGDGGGNTGRTPSTYIAFHTL